MIFTTQLFECAHSNQGGFQKKVSLTVHSQKKYQKLNPTKMGCCMVYRKSQSERAPCRSFSLSTYLPSVLATVEQLRLLLNCTYSNLTEHNLLAGYSLASLIAIL